ncbi:MAG: hypothetical protein WA666_06525 [Nitrospirota bacterium]
MAEGIAWEEKARSSGLAIKQALEKSGKILALYQGDRAGLVLLHMLKNYGGGRITVPVAGVQFLPLPGERLRFMDKLRRMWSLDIEVVRFPEKPGGGRYTGEEMTAEIDSVLLQNGASGAISSSTDFFEKDACLCERRGYTEFRPLCGFSDEDISAYIKRHGLPECSLDFDPAKVSERDKDSDNRQVANILRQLGYL